MKFVLLIYLCVFIVFHTFSAKTILNVDEY